MATLHEPKSLAAPIICQDSNPKTISDFAKQRHQEENAVDGPAHDAMNIWTDFTGRGVTTAAYRPRIMVADPDQINVKETLTLAWASSEERKRIIDLSIQERRQTMNLRTRKGAEVVVLRQPDERLVGWTGVDIKTDPVRPELFSQFVYPQFRGFGLGGLLEHFWWAYLDSHGYSTGFMRMELDSNQTLVERRLHSGYCRRATPEELGQQFVTACRNCELFGTVCHLQIFLAVDVQTALADRRRASGPLDINSLPLRIAVEPKKLNQTGQNLIKFLLFCSQGIRSLRVD